ncbi:MAG TPA: hypothetical protein VL752_06860 [Acidisoma sp.]|uniref:hypothetical protein n=1 Tax=Acidisoma sp. TaxID=1872115 RepID=UPI002B55A7B3|nr:hypothetical protein [Acidisoma sp.]HTI00652.1 hypothetical protein [Acidisoma sp.]
MRLKPGICRLLVTLAISGVAVQPAEAAPLHSGVWRGVYQCAQGLTGAMLTLTVAPDGTAAGLFEFFAIKQNPGVPRGCFEMAGRLDQAGHLALAPGAWRLRPPGFVTVGLDGQAIAGDRLVGEVQGPGCVNFALLPAKPGSLDSAPSACLGAIS